MSNRAALYLRSSKDRSDVSIDAQRRQLTELATAKRQIVVAEFTDTVVSGKDDDRRGFQALLRAIEQRDRGWEILMVLDTSRISRRMFISTAFENDCEKHGIAIVYKTLPDMEPAELLLFKTIMQGMDHYLSLKSKAKGLAGMAENIHQGWRAGGRAPRGYELEYHATGAIREGVPVMKSKLVPGPHAATMSAYLKGRAAGESRGQVLARLGLDWSAANLHGVEWQALTYAGHTVWNVHNERNGEGYVGGEKRRPRADWKITRNTHPALITDDEAEAIFAQLERQKTRRTRATDRPYLLTGLLTAPDGAPWHGEWDGKMDAALYRLGKGKKIAAHRVDGAVLARLREDLQSDIAIEQILCAMQNLVSTPVDGRAIAAAEKRLSSTVAKISRLVDLLAEAEPAVASAFQRSIAQYETERLALIEQLDDMRRAKANAAAAKKCTRLDAQRLTRLLFDGLEATIQEGGIVGVKSAIADLVERIELDPLTNGCSIRYRIETPVDTGLNLASPGGFEPPLPP
jgi:site-specific DNA recombinase